MQEENKNINNNINKPKVKTNWIIIGICVVVVILLIVVLTPKGGSKNNTNINGTEKTSSSDQSGVIKVKNLMMIQNNSFDPQTINGNYGESVTFQNNNRGPVKIIGDGWQTPYLDQGAIFTKDDFKQGQNNVYLESNPMNIGVINMK
ncbi:MAG TPA: hypothetical protein PLM63_02130 [bacterium]|nr:hypothetical protein [bacterium]